MIQWLVGVDAQLFLLINGWHSHLADVAMIRITGNLIWAPFYLVILFLLYKKFGIKGLWILLGVVLVVALADQGSVRLFKNVFERLRPCHNPEIKDMVHLVKGCGGKYGFVSSHAANLFGVATFLHLVFSKKWFSTIIFLWAALVSYSRIYLGVHYPGDIICGAILGIAIGKLVQLLYLAACKRFPQLPSIGNNKQ